MIDERNIDATVENGQVRFEAADRVDRGVDATIEAAPGTLLDIRLGRHTVAGAVRKRQLRFIGDAAGVNRLRRTFDLEPSS